MKEHCQSEHSHSSISIIFLFLCFSIGNIEAQERVIKGLEATAKTNAAAAYELGYYCVNGLEENLGDKKNILVKRNIPKALSLYKQAAAMGHSEAQYRLGFIYEHGPDFGVKRDDAEANRYYKMAAEGGLAAAQYALAEIEENKGPQGDYKEKVRWYETAAKQGLSGAQAMIARCYSIGMGVNRDQKRALAWAILASDQGDESASQLRDLILKSPEFKPGSEALKQAQETARELAREYELAVKK